MSTVLRGLLEVRGPAVPGDDEILTTEALSFLEDLVGRFGHRIDELLAAREVQQAQYDRGLYPDIVRTDTAERIRNSEWKVAPIPHDLLKRRVEITGPVDRKMIINALNSGADVFMADFEDSNSPTWSNIVNGQLNLRDARRGKHSLTYDDPKKGKRYRLNDDVAVLMVRPRGLHLKEKHVLYDGEPVSATLVDFGLYTFHNHNRNLRNGGLYFYLPKLESYLEARLWNDIFTYAIAHLQVWPTQNFKCTLLIETLPAAFQMNEIIYELRDYIVGLNCGRWDYIFSIMKTFRARASRGNSVLPDRGLVTMGTDFMSAYSRLLIQTCHKRGCFAMGGMAAQIPIKNDPAANEAALAKVRAGKEREFSDGHDGTWVAHPHLVQLALDVWEETADASTVEAGEPVINQLHCTEHVPVNPQSLLPTNVEKTYTEDCLRHNIDVGIRYLDAWLDGRGCVPLYDLMEDAATAEISRMQVWQWLQAGIELDTGKTVTRKLVEDYMHDTYVNMKGEQGPESHNEIRRASLLFSTLVFTDTPPDFLTLPAYELLEG